MHNRLSGAPPDTSESPLCNIQVLEPDVFGNQPRGKARGSSGDTYCLGIDWGMQPAFRKRSRPLCPMGNRGYRGLNMVAYVQSSDVRLQIQWILFSMPSAALAGQ